MHLDKIRTKFGKNSSVMIPLKRGGYFKAKLMDDGIWVSNLGNNPMLAWDVFHTAIELLVERREVTKGDAMNYKLGGSGLPLDSIEGRVAYKVYGKKEGQSVFRRIVPIAAILTWADICVDDEGILKLVE